MFRLYRGLEDAASKTNGLDRNSVCNLMDEVFKYPTYAQLAAALSTKLKNRIVDGEIAHRQGHSPGITDEALAKVFNEAAKKFGFPEYAQTSASQIRFLRKRSATRMPTFLGNVLSLRRQYPPMRDGGVGRFKLREIIQF